MVDESVALIRIVNTVCSSTSFFNFVNRYCMISLTVTAGDNALSTRRRHQKDAVRSYIQFFKTTKANMCIDDKRYQFRTTTTNQ